MLKPATVILSDDEEQPPGWHRPPQETAEILKGMRMDMEMEKGPRVCIGMTLHNNARHLPEAIDSLLSQTHSDFTLVAVDDGSTDDTESIMRGYAERDKRVHYFRNPQWQGMIATWRKAFWKCYDMHQPEFFAWASDHDRWHPDWLKKHLEAIQSNPKVALVFPKVTAIDSNGDAMDSDIVMPQDTSELGFTEHLYRVGAEQRGAGYAVYGLFRTHHLIQAGVFRPVALPDRLLLTEIAAYGKIKCLDETLWYRRFPGTRRDLNETLSSQRAYLFGPNPPPLYSYCPFLSHVIFLLTRANLFPTQKNASPLFRALTLAGLIWERRQDAIALEVQEMSRMIDTMAAVSAAETTPSGARLDRVSHGGAGILPHPMDPGPDHDVHALTVGILMFLLHRSSVAHELSETKQNLRELQSKMVEQNAVKRELKKKLADAAEAYRNKLDGKKEQIEQMQRDLRQLQEKLELTERERENWRGEAQAGIIRRMFGARRKP